MIVNKQGRWLKGSVCFLLPIMALPSIDRQFSTIASWYGPGFQGRKTASGQVFDQEKLTAASRTLPFGTRLSVENARNGRICDVTINDRGPYVKGRGIDLSHAAARQLGISGIGPVICYVHKPGVERPLYAPAPAPATDTDANADKDGGLIAYNGSSAYNQARSYGRRSRMPGRDLMPPRAPSIRQSLALAHRRREKGYGNSGTFLASKSISTSSRKQGYVASGRIAYSSHNDYNNYSNYSNYSDHIDGQGQSDAPGGKKHIGHVLHRWSAKIAHVSRFMGGVLASL